MSAQEILVACIIGIPIAFFVGRLSTRIAWFHATAEEKYSVPEFLQGKQEG